MNIKDIKTVHIILDNMVTEKALEPYNKTDNLTSIKEGESIPPVASKAPISDAGVKNISSDGCAGSTQETVVKFVFFYITKPCSTP